MLTLAYNDLIIHVRVGVDKDNTALSLLHNNKSLNVVKYDTADIKYLSKLSQKSEKKVRI